MKKLGTSMIALAIAGIMVATASAEANDKTRSANEQGRGQQRKARVAFVTNSQQQQGPMHSEAKYDFGDADSYDNVHPEGGG